MEVKKAYVPEDHLTDDARAMIEDPRRPKAKSAREAYAMIQFIWKRTKAYREEKELTASYYAMTDAERDAVTAKDPWYFGHLTEKQYACQMAIVSIIKAEGEAAERVAAVEERRQSEEWWLDYLGEDEEHGTTVVDFRNAVKKSDKWCRIALTNGIREGLVRTSERRTRAAGSATKVYWRADTGSDEGEDE